MPIGRRDVFVLIICGALAIGAALGSAWMSRPAPLAIGVERADGYFIVLDMRDESFEWACLSHFHYGALISKPVAFDCGACAVSAATAAVVASDESSPVRLAVWRNKQFDVYEVGGELINSAAAIASICTVRSVDVARCDGVPGEACVYRFKTGRGLN